MRVNILGSEIDVVFCNLDAEKVDGLYSPSEKLIKIHDQLEPNEAQLVILHEMIHALLDRVGAYSVIADEIQEVICDTIPHMILENFLLKLVTTNGNQRGHGTKALGSSKKGNRIGAKAPKGRLFNGSGHRQNGLRHKGPSREMQPRKAKA